MQAVHLNALSKTELVAFLDTMPTFNLDHQIMLGARDYMAGMAEPRDAYARADVTIEDLEIPGPEGAPAVRITVYTPAGAARPMPAYVHLHGGAFLMGSPAFAGRENNDLAADLGCLIVSVDYRCAPRASRAGRDRGQLCRARLGA